ncbi:MAG: type IX secretion system membrane protein PorP/SprF [Saprospiraceae bacterium]|nr:type IX secretion system membrane protein PorP/SprF [Saprospiraceae bacterium]
MKYFYISILILGMSSLAISQQEQQYTQFMFNKLGINPAYAGTQDMTCITGVYRNQWIGFEGAPKTQLLSFNSPLGTDRIGLGVNAIRHTIGITKSVNVDLAYAYRFKLSAKSRLSLGLQGALRYYGRDYSDPRLVATQGLFTDGSIPYGVQNKYVPNFGLGVYFQSPGFYMGISAPRLISNNIDFSTFGTDIGKEQPHVFGMVGVTIGLGKNLKLQPQILTKITKNSPIDFDGNVMLLIKDRYYVGATYRYGGSTAVGIGESIDVLLGAEIIKNLLFGFSYDITLSEIKDYTSGSIEAVIRYCIPTKAKSDVKTEEYINPRFF